MTYFEGDELKEIHIAFPDVLHDFYNAHCSSLLYLMLFCHYMETPKASRWQQTVAPNASTAAIVLYCFQ